MNKAWFIDPGQYFTIFYCGTCNSMEFMPSAWIYMQSLQKDLQKSFLTEELHINHRKFAFFQKKKKKIIIISPGKQYVLWLWGNFMLSLLLSFFHLPCKCLFWMLSSVTTTHFPCTFANDIAFWSFLRKSPYLEELLKNSANRRCFNKHRRPFWCFYSNRSSNYC